MTAVPVIVNNGRLDALAANPLGHALFAPVFADPARPANHARFTWHSHPGSSCRRFSRGRFCAPIGR